MFKIGLSRLSNCKRIFKIFWGRMWKNIKSLFRILRRKVN